MLVTLVLVAAVAALVVYMALEGPDQSQVGVVTTAEPHRLCIAEDDGEFCAHVDSSSAVTEIEVGDCIELRRSSDDIFESAHPSDRC